jgi:hypothetical protein
VARSFTTPDCGARSLQHFLAVRQLGNLFAQPLGLRCRLGALGLQLPAIVRCDLRKPRLRLCDRCARSRSQEFLTSQILLFLDKVPLALRMHQTPCESIARELFERALLLPVMRQHTNQLRLHFLCRRKIMTSPIQYGTLLGERVLVCPNIGEQLRFGSNVRVWRVVRFAQKGRSGQLRIYPAQNEPLGVIFGAEAPGIRGKECSIHAREGLTVRYTLALANQHFDYDALLDGLNDLEITGRNELSLSDCDDVQPGESRPQQCRREEREQRPQHGASER